MKIIIAEDDYAQRETLAAKLTAAGYDVLPAAHGERAWETWLAQEGQPTIVLADWAMPRIDGLELTRRIRKREDGHGYTYIVLLTGRVGPDSEAEGLEAGVDDYIRKPPTWDTLIARLRTGERIIRLEGDLRHMATHDHLTGLANRRAFVQRLEEEVGRAMRYSHRLSLILADVDHFKKINDQLGHLQGDAVLAGVARAITFQVRSSDLPARWGGKEFAVLLPETDRSPSLTVAEKIRIAVSQIDVLPGEEPVTVSLGVATLPDEAESADGLVMRADAALALAKTSGRNRVAIYP